MIKLGAFKKIQVLALMVLFYATVSTVWRIGPMHSDDAVWIVHAHKSSFSAAWDWAISQGRLYAIVVGSFMLHAFYWDGTIYGEFLKFFWLGIFILLFARVISVYFGWRLSILSTSIFLGFHALRFDGSAFITYPLLIWPSFCGLLISVLTGRRYILSGRINWLLLSGLGLFFSLFTNEAMTATFLLLFFLSCFGNCWLGLDGGVRYTVLKFSRRDIVLFLSLIVIALVYSMFALVFAFTYPTTYEGHNIAKFSIYKIAKVTWSFSTSGTIIGNFFNPFRINYSDFLNNSGVSVAYNLRDAFRDIGGALPSTFFGLTVALLCLASMIGSGNPEGNIYRLQNLRSYFALVPGLVLIIFPVLPVALTNRYQDWHLNLGVGSYITTIISHLGISLTIAAFLAGILDIVSVRRRLQIFFSLTVAVCAGIIAFAGFRTNEAIAYDMRIEGARWRAMRTAISLIDSSIVQNQRVIIPQFRGSSWYTIVNSDYWSNYAQVISGKYFRFSYDEISEADLDQGALLISYVMSDNRRQFDVIASHLVADTDGAPKVDRILIQIGNSTRNQIANSFLSYYDRRMGLRQIPLATIESANYNQGRFEFSDLNVIPGSIFLTRQSTPGAIVAPCRSHMRVGSRISFGRSYNLGDGFVCNGSSMLLSGWSAVEASGTWTNSYEAVVSIPASVIGAEISSLALDINTYTGMGFTRGQQVIHISGAGFPSQSLAFETGHQLSPVVLTLSNHRSDSPIDIRFRIENPIRPSSIGLGQDTRDLGVFLRSIRLQ